MKKPKVLFFDIESSPNEGYFWDKLYDTRIIKKTKAAEMLCFSHKWQDRNKIVGVSQYTAGSEKAMITELHPVFNEMDYLVGHNVNRFDRRWSNTVFGKYSLTKPSPYKIIDTMNVMKQNFYLPSYSMEACAEFFGIDERKKKIGWEVWEAAIEGDSKAYSVLLSYNKQDIKVLEALYDKLVEGGWISDPMLPVEDNKPEECSVCGGERLKSKGYDHYKEYSVRRFLCLSCGKENRVKI